MNKKEFYYTDEQGVQNWEDGLIFMAVSEPTGKFNTPFTVSSSDVVERRETYVTIDTGSDAEF